MQRTLATATLAALLLGACGKDAPPPAAQQAEAPATPAATAPPQLDSLSGLKMTGDWQIVRANCTPCHSGKLITQQRGTAEQWLAMIRWMQEKQNLWQFDPVTEEKIVNYLAENYPPGRSQRRAALAPELMPPNPYSGE